VGKTTVVYVKFLPDAVCQELSKSANVSRSYSKNKSGTFLLRNGVVTNCSQVSPMLPPGKCEQEVG